MKQSKNIIIFSTILLLFLFPDLSFADEKPEIFVQLGHTRTVKVVAFSPDGKYALSGGGEGAIKLWEIATGRELKTVGINSDTISCIDISPDGRYAFTGSYNNKILKMWDVATGKEIRTFTGHSYRVDSVTFSPDGRYALSGSADKTLKLWDIATGKEIRTFTGHLEGIFSVAFSPDGRCVLSGSIDKTIKLWDVESGKEIRTFSGHSGWIYSVIFSPDGRYVLSGSIDKTIKLWDVESGTEIRTFTGHSEGIHSVAFSPDGRYALSGSSDKTMKLWDVVSGREIRTFKGHSAWVESLTYSPDGGWHVLSASADKTLMLWDVTTGKEIRTLTGHSGEMKSVVFSPDGRYALMSSGKDKVFKLWSMTNGVEIKTFREEHSNVVFSTAFSPDGRCFLSGSDKILKLWDVESGIEIRTFRGKSRGVHSVAFSPDGRHVLSGSDDKTLKLWDVESGTEIRTFPGHSAGWIYSVAFSPDGRHVLSGSNDQTIKLWDVESGKEIRTFTGHSGWIHSVVFSPDGRYALSSSGDNTTRLWNISTGREIAQFVRFTDGEWIVITPKGYFNASANGAKHLNVRIGMNVYSIDNFYEKFFNPMYVASALQGKKVEATADIRKGILTPPEVRITSPASGSQFNTDTLTVTVAAKDTGGGIDEIRLYHNGKAIGDDTRAVKIVSKGNEAIRQYAVSLVDGLNTFRAVGFSKDRTESNPYELSVILAAASKDVSLYVLAVGINKYKNPALNLNYAEPDARGITDFFQKQDKGLFKNIAIREIYNEQATKENIISQLNKLQNINAQDAVLIYLAGHGENINNKWYFIPHELTYPEREEDVKAKGLSSDELSGYMKNIKAQKILMLIDACKSGAVLVAFRGFEDRKALSQLSRSTGVHIVAASSKDQFAAEVKELGHGVFTYTLLEGLGGKAAGAHEAVTVRKLMGYVEGQLPEITKKYKQEAQYPVVDSRGMDFPLVIAK